MQYGDLGCLQGRCRVVPVKNGVESLSALPFESGEKLASKGLSVTVAKVNDFRGWLASVVTIVDMATMIYIGLYSVILGLQMCAVPDSAQGWFHQNELVDRPT